MRSFLVLAAAVAVTGVSAAGPVTLETRQTIVGCEDSCNPVMDWAVTCRTNIPQCMEECNAELLAQSDACVQCMETTNPDGAAAIARHVDSVRGMCGDEAAPSSASASASAASASASASAAASSEAEAQSSAAATAASSGAAQASASSAAAAASGSASVSGSAAPSAPSNATTSAPPSGGMKNGVALGAIVLAAAPFIL